VSRLLASLIAHVHTSTIAGYLVGTSVVIVACLVAAYVPSRRVTGIDPVTALRAD
jgi:ABC-type antimicrobial peptide transport system permease subunit